MNAAKVGKRGAIIVPAKLRKRFGLTEGSFVTAEARSDGILLRPAVIVPLERYTLEPQADFYFLLQPARRTTSAYEKK